MGKAIGIDLGTTNSVVAYKDNSVRIIQTGANNEDLCRSCVALDARNTFLVGNTVYRNWRKYTPHIVVSVKRLMGVKYSDDQVTKMRGDKRAYPFDIVQPPGTDDAVAVMLRGQYFSPEQISAEILKQLKADANKKLGDVTHAVITVPAYFTEKQKTATMKAAQLAGLHVQQLLAEPTAAAISYGFDKLLDGESKNILVYDFGGGTFDLSILTAMPDQFIEMGSGGDRWLGGDDIDRLLSDYVCKQVEQRDGFRLNALLSNKSDKEKAAFTSGLKSGIEEAKKALSQTDHATIYFSEFLEDDNDDPVDDYDISRTTFDALIRPIVQRTIDLIDELLTKCAFPEDTIDNILLVGGSSCIPLVRTMLSDRYGKEKVMYSDKPMLAVAEGAAILAHALPSTEGELTVSAAAAPPPPIDVVTTTKHRTFIEVVNSAGGVEYEEIIMSQQPLPYETKKKFFTTIANQKIVEVKLFNDIENGGYTKIASGFFTITDNLPLHSELYFTFSLDVNELLSVEVTVPKTGTTTTIRLARGNKDDHCLRELAQRILAIQSNSQLSSQSVATFLTEIQAIIEDINTHDYAEDDQQWDTIEQNILSAYSRAQMGQQQDNNLPAILAGILLNEFRRFLSASVAQQLNHLLARANNANNELEKNAIMQELEDIVNQYQLLIHVFLFKLVGDNATDARTASSARCAYDEMIQALDNKDIHSVISLTQQHEGLLEAMKGDNIDISSALGH